MKTKVNYYRDESGNWAFEIINTCTRTYSEGYRTKQAAREIVRDIKNGLKYNSK